MLEAEIRRELIIEQELAMYRSTTGHRTTEKTKLEFDEHFAARLVEQRLKKNHIVDQSSSRGLLAVGDSSISSLKSFSVLPPFPSEHQKEELKHLDVGKDSLIFLVS